MFSATRNFSSTQPINQFLGDEIKNVVQPPSNLTEIKQKQPMWLQDYNYCCESALARFS